MLGLLGNYWYAPHSSTVGISFPGVVIFGFVQLSLNDLNWWLPAFLILRAPCNFPVKVHAPYGEFNSPDNRFGFPEGGRQLGEGTRSEKVALVLS